MVNAIKIFRAEEHHINKAAILFDLYRQFYGKDADISSCEIFLKQRFLKDEIIIFIAEINDKVAGISNIYPTFSSVSLAPVWTLNDLYVHGDFRRMGVADALLQYVENDACKNGVVSLQLETAPDNLNAQKCYEKNGWTENAFKFYGRSIKKTK